MIAHFEQFVKKFEGKTTKIYLIIANVVLVTLAISASNAGLLPFRNLGDFAFFLILGAVFAIYRPGWSFLFFIGSAALENINLAPVSLGIAMRPYQFFAAITLVSLIIGYFSKRLSFELPKWRWYDFAVIVFVFGGFLSALFSMDKGASFKQTIVALSFAVIYFLTRIYIQGYSDFKRVLPFFLSSSMVVMIYAFWQNIRFNLEMNSFEVNNSGFSYTYKTLEYFNQLEKSTEWYFLTGSDCFTELHYWKNVNTILKLCNFVVFNRPGFDEQQVNQRKLEVEKKYNKEITLLQINPLDISSSMIRQKIKDHEEIEDLVPQNVGDYIKKHNLYKNL